MNMLILTTEDKQELEAINYGGDPARQLQPVPLTDGNFGLNADLLEDCGPGQTWSWYAEFLDDLARADATPQVPEELL